MSKMIPGYFVDTVQSELGKHCCQIKFLVSCTESIHLWLFMKHTHVYLRFKSTRFMFVQFPTHNPPVMYFIEKLLRNPKVLMLLCLKLPFHVVD